MKSFVSSIYCIYCQFENPRLGGVNFQVPICKWHASRWTGFGHGPHHGCLSSRSQYYLTPSLISAAWNLLKSKPECRHNCSGRDSFIRPSLVCGFPAKKARKTAAATPTHSATSTQPLHYQHMDNYHHYFANRTPLERPGPKNALGETQLSFQLRN